MPLPSVQPEVQDVLMQIKEGFRLRLNDLELVPHIQSFDAQPQMDWLPHLQRWVPRPLEVSVTLIFTQR